jgi:manganese/zinc/iron transport system substrate-binding protein
MHTNRRPGPTPRPNALRRAAAACALLFALAAPTSVHAQADDARLDVVTTIGMVGDVVREVGGTCVDVTVLMGPGIDPHLYRASAGDVEALRRADLIVYNGHNLEGQLGAVLASLEGRTPTIALSERIGAGLAEGRLLVGEDDFEGQTDPHLWGAADLWVDGADVVAQAIADLAPACADDARARAATFREQLTALHAWALESVASVPEAHRTIVSAHDAFAYFGAAYGFEVAGIEGISTESEASIADIRETADLIVELGVPAIFIETTISPRTIEAVQAAVRDRGAEVAIGGELFGDAMGDEGTAEGTYIGMVRHNVVTIVTGLGGEVAPWPETLIGWAEAWMIR